MPSVAAERVNPNLAEKVVPIDSVKPHPQNYNKHNIGKIKESLARNGQYRSIVVDETTGFILAGNGTWAAAKALGWQQIAVEHVRVDEQTARRILLVDNFAATDEYDYKAVIDILEQLGQDFSGTGISADDFESMVAKLNGDDKSTDTASKLDDYAAYAIIVECEDERQQADLLDRFAESGLNCRAYTT